MSVDSRDLIERLRSKYCRPQWMSMAEVREAMGFGRGITSIDFMAVSLWPSKWSVVAVEVKVTLADFRRELDRPQKRAAFEERCTEFWFCAPRGVIPVEELPEGAGLYETWGSRLQAKRRAVQRQGHEPDSQMWLSIMRHCDRAIHRSESHEFAELGGKRVTFADLRSMASKLRPHGVGPDFYREFYEKQRQERIGRTNYINALHQIKDRLVDLLRDQGMQVGWKPKPEEVLELMKKLDLRGAEFNTARLRDAAVKYTEAAELIESAFEGNGK